MQSKAKNHLWLEKFQTFVFKLELLLNFLIGYILFFSLEERCTISDNCSESFTKGLCLLLEEFEYGKARSNKVFSRIPIVGTNKIKCKKYITVEICPMVTKGSSGCWEPIHNNIKKFTKKVQLANLIKGLNWLPLILDISTIGNINSINNEPNIATTPKNLLGIDLNIA